MDEASDPGAEGGLNHRPDAVLVDLAQPVFIPLPVGDEPGEMDDMAVPGRRRPDGFLVGDVPVERPHSGSPPRHGNSVSREDERGNGPDAVPGDEFRHQNRADEARRPGDKDPHGLPRRRPRKRKVSVAIPVAACRMNV